MTNVIEEIEKTFESDYMKHLVNRLEFEFGCADEEQAFDLRSTFALTYQEQVIHWIDEICSKHVRENEVVQIDRIEIDLGTINFHAFSDSFSSAFCYGFEKKLISHFQSNREGPYDPDQNSGNELIQQFLLQGTIPWWGDEFSGDINGLILELFSGNDSYLRVFLTHNRNNGLIWKRLAWQFNDQVHSHLISAHANLTTALMIFRQLAVSFQDSVQPVGSVIIPPDRLIQQLIIANAPVLFEKETERLVFFELFEQLLLRTLPSEKVENINFIRAAIEKWKTDLQAGSVNNFTPSSPTNEFINSFLLQPVDSLDQEHSKRKTGNPLLNSGDASFSELYRNTPGARDVEAKLPVRYAGLVLLGPFLKPFFQELRFLGENAWLNDTVQYKAIHLLQYLASGQKNVPEFKLTFEKILCGIDINAPVPVDLPFHEKEWKEADLLLESVIEHWKALKSTSVNGLRDTFLKRDGLLIKKEVGWLLQVERKTLDVLLDNIPWGYSTLALPWMPQHLYVEW